MRPSPRRAAFRPRLFQWGALAMLALAAAADAAVPVVYHSPADDGSKPALPIEISPGVPTTVHLYLDGGSTPSSSDPCHLGNGEEVCGWDLVLQGASGLSLIGFSGNGDVVASLVAGVLRANGGEPQAGTLGPVKLGDLVVQGTTGASLELLPSRSVNADLGLDSIPAVSLVSVPEPTAALGLAAGAALLAALARGQGRC